MLHSTDRAAASGRGLPRGSDFAALRAANLIYIDKTPIIYYLTCIGSGAYKFARPAGFGRTTLISTLEELFVHGVEPYCGHDSWFKGLYIEQHWQERAGVYAVLKLDFAGLFDSGRAPSLESFERNLACRLSSFAAEHHIELPELSKHAGANDILRELCSNAKGNDRGSLVLLIDNYDAPFVRLEQDTEALRRMHSFWEQFNRLLKAFRDKFRFIFVSGSLNFEIAACFASASCLENISQSPRSAYLCGFSREECALYFKEALSSAAAQRHNVPPAEITDDDLNALLCTLERWYGGFSFDTLAAARLLHPQSVLKFLNNNRSEFKVYRQGLESAFTEIVRLKADDELELADLRRLTEPRAKLYLHSWDFMHVTSVKRMSALQRLFQDGFLTLKAPIRSADFGVKFKVPNLEIKTMLKHLAKTVPEHAVLRPYCSTH
ncbi:MAG: AAA family ATPase [Proteobacteria bacterium]|uniref:AAA family ATPase n=1 Tax=Candidatus Avisuccinivibrio stercorigallinarum TaxID=2840704 RepID=A0A9D9DEP3_9GAMM|nr:AAA family ATPase [Candidatus Avisuccinivibrio stercorigallinarum]